MFEPVEHPREGSDSVEPSRSKPSNVDAPSTAERASLPAVTSILPSFTPINSRSFTPTFRPINTPTPTATSAPVEPSQEQFIPRISGRKRAAEEIDYSHMAAPTKKTKPTPKPVQKQKASGKGKGTAAEIEECSCDMGEKWKRDLALWEELDFETQKGLVEELHGRARFGEDFYRTPCHQHLMAISNKLSVGYVANLDTMLERFSDIFDVVEDRTSFRRAWVHPITRALFINNAEIEAFKSASLIRDRFRTVRAAAVTPSPASSQGKSLDFGDKGVFVGKGFLDWIDKNVREMLLSEIEMLRFHVRQGTLARDGLLPNSYFPLAVQLLWADPALWLLFHRLANGNPVFLVAHPVPIRVYDKGEGMNVQYEGDRNLLSSISPLCAEVLLDGETRDINYLHFSKPSLLGPHLQSDLGSEKFVSFEKGDKWEDYLDSFGKEEGVGKEIVLVPFRRNEVYIYKFSCLTVYDFVEDKALTKPWICLPVRLVAILPNGQCETGVPYEVLQESHRKRQVPSIGRFKDTAGDQSFIGSVQLEGVGALFDMIRCVKPIDHPAVRSDMKKWLAFNNSSADRHIYTSWKKLATDQIKVAFQYLKDAEMEMFPGNKSYFRCMAESLEPPAEDPEYIVISDDETGDNTESTSYLDAGGESEGDAGDRMDGGEHGDQDEGEDEGEDDGVVGGNDKKGTVLQFGIYGGDSLVASIENEEAEGGLG
jgi:hypothetical protein